MEQAPPAQNGNRRKREGRHSIERRLRTEQLYYLYTNAGRIQRDSRQPPGLEDLISPEKRAVKKTDRQLA